MARSRTEFVDDGPGPGLLEPSGTIRDASTPTFARVAEAARVAAACFPLDVAAFGVLPAGVSAASVASHATASALARAATAATDAVGELCAPPYGVTFETLDSAIADLRTKMRAENLGRPPRARCRKTIRSERASCARKRPSWCCDRSWTRFATPRRVSAEATYAIAPERGVMHLLLGDVFAALRARVRRGAARDGGAAARRVRARTRARGGNARGRCVSVVHGGKRACVLGRSARGARGCATGGKTDVSTRRSRRTPLCFCEASTLGSVTSTRAYLAPRVSRGLRGSVAVARRERTRRARDSRRFRLQRRRGGGGGRR